MSSPLAARPSPTEWHRYVGSERTCRICDCPAAPLVRYKRGRRPGPQQQHRRIDGEKARARYERRSKSPWGWKVFPICLHRLGHRQSGERPRITDEALNILIRAAALLVTGQPPRSLCEEIGVAPSRLRYWRKHHRQLWDELLQQAGQIFGIVNAARRKEPAALPALSAWPIPAANRPQANPTGPLSGTIGRGMTLMEFFRSCYVPRRLIGRSKGTALQYEVTIRQFALYAGREVRLGDLSDDLVIDFMAWTLGNGRAVATANKCRRCVLALWRQAYRRKDSNGQRLVATLPEEVDRMPEPKTRPKTWTQEEFGRILEAAGRVGGEIQVIPARVWWPALLLVLYYSGIRIGAAMRIAWADLELSPKEGWLFVPAKHQKHRSDQRFKLPEDAVNALLAVRQHSLGALVFPWPYQPRCLYTRLRKILGSLSLPCGPRDLFHKIRRLSATEVAAKLGRSAAMDHLGHSAMTVTERYLDTTKIPTVRAADVIPRAGMPQTRHEKGGAS